MLAAAGDRAAGVGCEPGEAPRNLQSEADLDGQRREHGSLGVLAASRLAAKDGAAIRRVPAPDLLVNLTEFLFHCSETRIHLRFLRFKLRIDMRFDSPGDFQLAPRQALFDIHGLLVTSRTDLADFQKPFAQNLPPVSTFVEAIKLIKPTGIIGVSTVPKLFTQQVIEAMTQINERPIIFPYSNPTSRSECTAEEAYRWSRGKAIFASGSPFPPVELAGRKFVPGQGNNVYIFPAMGMAVFATEATRVTEEMFIVAAKAVAEQVTDEDLSFTHGSAKPAPSISSLTILWPGSSTVA